MLVCPNPDCATDLDGFDVETRLGMFGSGLWVDCPDCGHSFEVEVLIVEPRPEPLPVLLDFDDGLSGFPTGPQSRTA